MNSDINNHVLRSPKEFLRATRLIFSNCVAFNEPGSELHGCAMALSALFEALWRMAATLNPHYDRINTKQHQERQEEEEEQIVVDDIDVGGQLPLKRSLNNAAATARSSSDRSIGEASRANSASTGASAPAPAPHRLTERQMLAESKRQELERHRWLVGRRVKVLLETLQWCDGAVEQYDPHTPRRAAAPFCIRWGSEGDGNAAASVAKPAAASRGQGFGPSDGTCMGVPGQCSWHAVDVHKKKLDGDLMLKLIGEPPVPPPAQMPEPQPKPVPTPTPTPTLVPAPDMDTESAPAFIDTGMDTGADAFEAGCASLAMVPTPLGHAVGTSPTSEGLLIASPNFASASAPASVPASALASAPADANRAWARSAMKVAEDAATIVFVSRRYVATASRR